MSKFEVSSNRLFLLVLIFLTITACGDTKPTNNVIITHQAEVVTPAASIYVQASSVVYTSFEEIVAGSSVIVIGTPASVKGVVNTARDPKDLTQQDSNYFGIGQVYEVLVDSYLKGNGPGLIYVIQNEGLIPSKPEEITNAEIIQAQKLSDTLQLTVGKQYIMFLSPSEFSYENFSKDGLFIGRGHPWRFEVISSVCVQPEDTVTEVIRYFPSQPLDKFIEFINDPSAFPGNSYPAPDTSVGCVPGNVRPYP